MDKSKLIYSKKINGNKIELETYSNENIRSEDTFEVLYDGRLDLAKKLIKKFNLKGNVLELGAGYSWLTAEISKVNKVENAYCCDFSKEAMVNVAPRVFKKLNANTKKITRVVGDFSNIPVEDNTFDFIIFEAAFHHVVDYKKTLKELRRVLKPNGVILCTRERIILEGRNETNKAYFEHKKSGILERIFTLSEWRFICEINYFHFSYVPFYFYKDKNKKLNDWVKYFLDINPFFKVKFAKRFNCLVFVIRPKAYEELE